MIIVSQDEDFNLNYDNVESIAILNPLEDNKGMFKVCAITSSDNEYTLGWYATKERAREVLQEIIIAIRGKNIVQFSNGEMKEVYPIKNDVYEMPLT